MSHSLDFYFPRELKKRCYVLYFMFLFSYTSHCLYFIYLEWFETISESNIFPFFYLRFICFLLMHLSRPCIPGAQAPIIFYFRGSTRPQGSKFSSPSLYYCILDFQAPIPPIPFYSRFPGPYASYTILFQVPWPLYLLYYCIHRCPAPLCLLYHFILGSQAPIPPIFLYSRCHGPYASYIIVF